MFRIGEDVVGWLDFAEATVPCYQVIMALETEEEIPRKYWKSAEIAVSKALAIPCRNQLMVV